MVTRMAAPTTSGPRVLAMVAETNETKSLTALIAA